jgi:hypothetical protein
MRYKPYPLEAISRCQVVGILPTFYERVTLKATNSLSTWQTHVGAATIPQDPTPCRKSLWKTMGARLHAEVLIG